MKFIFHTDKFVIERVDRVDGVGRVDKLTCWQVGRVGRVYRVGRVDGVGRVDKLAEWTSWQSWQVGRVNRVGRVDKLTVDRVGRVDRVGPKLQSWQRSAVQPRLLFNHVIKPIKFMLWKLVIWPVFHWSAQSNPVFENHFRRPLVCCPCTVTFTLSPKLANISLHRLRPHCSWWKVVCRARMLAIYCPHTAQINAKWYCNMFWVKKCYSSTIGWATVKKCNSSLIGWKQTKKCNFVTC